MNASILRCVLARTNILKLLHKTSCLYKSTNNSNDDASIKSKSSIVKTISPLVFKLEKIFFIKFITYTQKTECTKNTLFFIFYVIIKITIFGVLKTLYTKYIVTSF